MITPHQEGPNLYAKKPQLLTFKSKSSGCHSSLGLQWTFNSDDGTLKNANMIRPSRNVYRKKSAAAAKYLNTRRWFITHRIHRLGLKGTEEQTSPGSKINRNKSSEKGRERSGQWAWKEMWKWEEVAKGEWWPVDLWAFWYLNHPFLWNHVPRSHLSARLTPSWWLWYSGDRATFFNPGPANGVALPPCSPLWPNARRELRAW